MSGVEAAFGGVEKWKSERVEEWKSGKEKVKKWVDCQRGKCYQRHPLLSITAYSVGMEVGADASWTRPYP